MFNFIASNSNITKKVSSLGAALISSLVFLREKLVVGAALPTLCCWRTQIKWQRAESLLKSGIKTSPAGSFFEEKTAKQHQQ